MTDDANKPIDPAELPQSTPGKQPVDDPALAIDPAEQSLSDALQVSFTLLKIVMIVMVFVYIFSGTYQVPEQEAAVVTRFGQIVGEGDDRVKESGWYLGFPFPIDNVIHVPINERTVELSKAFVYETTEADAALTADERQGGPLNPERDGSLITGDANIVHARFSATYAVSDPAAFITNVKDMDQADALVRGVVEQAIVHAVASVTADDFIAGRYNGDTAQAKAQAELDQLDSGLSINNLSIDQPQMPLSVRQAYGLVSAADATRSTAINEAQKERNRLLGEAAGKAALPTNNRVGPLVELIKEYELATATDDDERLQQLDERLSEAFRQLEVQRDGETFDISGDAARIVNQALIEKTQIVERIKSEANTVQELSESYNRDPALFRDLMWQTAARDIFQDDSDIERWYLMPGSQLYLEMNRDPEISRQREERRLEAAREAAREEQQ